ncbi:hypothetical protein [Methylobacterium sp. WL8]|uniref:hypothetical protein n=1 Tax=Methylobacterium sp. WL8 TaxID=2603899 RepID=UPI00164FBD7D|nr:hypothetical protein [Methylobacterium sp. WL8]
MKAPATIKAVREPHAREKQENAAALKRLGKRRVPFKVKIQATGEDQVLVHGAPHSDALGHHLRMLDTFGTASPEFASRGFGRLGAVMRDRGQDLPTEEQTNAALAAMSGIAPQDECESMLASQMVATNEVAMEMLTRAKMATSGTAMQECGTLAVKLLRTFTAQAEAMAKLRRGGEQKVTVEHVHVHEGGQAIVGNVTTGKGGGYLEKGDQPHALTGSAALALSDGATMLREDPRRDRLPVASGEREDEVPDARRRPRKRRTEG